MSNQPIYLYISKHHITMHSNVPMITLTFTKKLLESVIDVLITSLLLLWPETKHDDMAIWTIVSVAIVFSIIIYFFYLFNS